MGFVEDSIRKVWVGTNVSANSWRFKCACSSHKKTSGAFPPSSFDLPARTETVRRGAVASEDEKRKLVALYTHTVTLRSHAGRTARGIAIGTRTDRGPPRFLFIS